MEYFNEIDPYAAQWLRNLIDAGHLGPGIVDERSIEDVQPSDLSGFDRCHFFAGIGVWSYALRQAGWPDDVPVWTGSCPCQPFSQAGKGAGFDDERHLWPAFHWLIDQCRPPVLFGEQVASKIVDDWLDLVSTDLEALGFTFGSIAFPSAGVGAPHIRDRTYFVADANYARPQGWWGVQERASKRAARSRGVARGMADAGSVGRERRQGAADRHVSDRPDARRQQGNGIASRADEARALDRELREWFFGELADSADVGFDGRRSGEASDGRDAARLESERLRFVERIEPAGPVNGFWRDADWLSCRDEKWRPVEPGTFPLVDGASARVGRLRAYGNAIVAPQAIEFIRVAMECVP